MLSGANHLIDVVRRSCHFRSSARFLPGCCWIGMTAAAALALNFFSLGCQKASVGEKVDPNAPVEVSIPEQGAYTGAFIDFGDTEDELTLEGIEDFEAM